MKLYHQLLDVIAVHRVADRPDRFDRRLRKRRPKKYDKLIKSRHETKMEMLKVVSKKLSAIRRERRCTWQDAVTYVGEIDRHTSVDFSRARRRPHLRALIGWSPKKRPISRTAQHAANH